MPSWYAEVILAGDLTTPTQEELTAELPGFAVISIDQQASRATIGVVVDEATTLRQATDAALKAVTDAARTVLGKAPTLLGVRVLTEADHQAEVEHPPGLDLVGATEGAKILGVSRQRFEQLAKEHPMFPRHVNIEELARGRVYTRASIQRFNERWERRRTGRPPKRKPA
jgi:hypothetical protein